MGALLLGTTIPLVYLVVRTLSPLEGDFSSGSIFTARTGELLLNTLLLAAAVLASTTLLAVPLAWLTTCTRLPFRRVATVLLVLPLPVLLA